MTTYPKAVQKPVIYSIHNFERQDDYEWIKTQGKDDPEVKAYLEAENTYLDQVLEPYRDLQNSIYNELVSYLKEEDENPPISEGDWEYSTRTEIGEPHRIYVRRSKINGEIQNLLNVNDLVSKENLTNAWVYGTAPSKDGRYWAFLLDSVGGEVGELRVLDTTTGQLAEKPVLDASTVSMVWSSSGACIYYTKNDYTNRPFQLWRHLIGESQDRDQLILEEADPTYRIWAKGSENGRSILVCCYSSKCQEWYALSANDDSSSIDLIVSRNHGLEIPELTDGGDHWIFFTNKGNASEFRLMQLSKNPESTLSDAIDVYPYNRDMYLTSFTLFEKYLVLSGREEGLSQIWILDRVNGGYGLPRRVNFPEKSYAVRIGINKDYSAEVARIWYFSLTRPTEHLDLNLTDLSLTCIKKTAIQNYNAENYITERSWVTANDGVKVPISLVRHKDTRLPAPTVLYGYGSYGESAEPAFSSLRLPLLNRGWIWVIAHVRGGAELGRHWYDDGRLQNKMNTFNDFISVGEELKISGHSTKLVAIGRSAGGLLIGAVVNMRPDLWDVAILGVPFLDTLNTMLDESLPLTVNEYGEWGNPKFLDDYLIIERYSPYDNLERCVYPNMYLSTGINDARVGYWESAKYIAKARSLMLDNSGIIGLRTELESGHFSSSGRYEQIHNAAEELTFIIASLDKRDY